MVDTFASMGYAGDAALEEDMHGMPTYSQFKKFATFNPALADFGVDLRGLTRLLAEGRYGVGPGGMGTGDAAIQFAAAAGRRGALPYEGVIRLCRQLRPRVEKVEHMRAAAAAGGRGADPLALGGGGGGELQGGGAGVWAASRVQSLALRSRSMARGEAGAAPGAAAAGAGGAAEAGGRGGGGEGGRVAGRGVSFKPPALDRESSIAGAPQPPAPHGPHPAATTAARPASASRLGTSLASPGAGAGGGPHTAPHSPGAHSPGAEGGPSTSGRGAAVPDGLSTLMALREPPVLLREQLPPPPCAFPAIAARIHGIQVLYRDGEMTRVELALRDLQRDWEDAAEAAATAAALRRSAAAAAGSSGGWDAAAGGSGARGEIPLDGRIWLLLLHACCLMLGGKMRPARLSLQAAESLFNPNILGLEHPYHYCIHLCAGLLAYYEQQFEAAIDKFEAARELADLVSRGTFDVTARRNAAACLNNKGVCHSLLGHRSEAVLAFRAAYQQVRAAAGVPEVPEAVVAGRNLNRALKQGFALNTSRLRPTSAPPMYAAMGSTAVPRDQKLQTFLRAAITLRAPAPVTAVPTWATKTTADEVAAKKKAKELAAKQKAKQATGDKAKAKKVVKKEPPFNGMANYPAPSYGVANVKLEVAKKKGRKKAA